MTTNQPSAAALMQAIEESRQRKERMVGIDGALNWILGRAREIDTASSQPTTAVALCHRVVYADGQASEWYNGDMKIKSGVERAFGPCEITPLYATPQPAEASEVTGEIVAAFDAVYEREWDIAAGSPDESRAGSDGSADRHATRSAIQAIAPMLRKVANPQIKALVDAAKVFECLKNVIATCYMHEEDREDINTVMTDLATFIQSEKKS